MNPEQQLLDPLPVPVLFLLFFAIAFGLHEAGFRVGAWQARRDPSEKDGPISLLVGAILALMGFFLATTTAMAADRFEARRALVGEEASAIGTTFLRAGYLPEPASTEVQDLLRAYAPLRINVLDEAAYAANLAASKAMLDDLWAEAEAVARTHGDQPVVALFVESLNDAFDVLAAREAALTSGRLPESLVILLLFGAFLSAAIVGYHAGLTNRRGLFGASVLIVVLSAALVLVIDLDRPRDGLLRVSQQPIEDLIEAIGAPQP